VQIIVVHFEPHVEYTAIEIVGAATDWHAALLIAREHAAGRLTYDGSVNVNRDTPENRTEMVSGGQYVMTTTFVRLDGQS
jgi:hypothetical protein